MAPMVGFPGLMAGPLKLPDYRSVWPEHLRPRGEDTIEKETFDCWWSRNGAELAHLPSVLCEQWIHRHWTHSPFSFLPLQTLAWLKRSLGGEELLGSVYRAFAGELNPQFDYETFHRRGARTVIELPSRWTAAAGNTRWYCSRHPLGSSMSTRCIQQSDWFWSRATNAIAT